MSRFSLLWPQILFSKFIVQGWQRHLLISNCSVSVHDSSCKDQVAACTKFKSQRMIQRPLSSSVKEKVHSLPQSLMARDKGQSLPAPKVSQSLSPVSPGGSTSIASSSVLPSRVIEEAEETEVNRSDAHSNITDTYSVSTESLDDGGGSPAVDFEDDPDLAVKGPEPEAWSVTVDKKTIKHLKLSSKDVKRQDHIWELIQTEKHYNRVLKVMQKIFAFGMRHEVNMTQEHVDRIFPGLNELIEVHQAFQGRLRERQEARTDKYIENISDVLIAQYGGDVGERMKRAYGDFVSHHKEALAYYKDLLKQDKKFQMFIKKCSTNLLCKRMSVDECMLYVTQRLSKYPPLIEAVIKPMKDASRDMKAEKDGLRQAVQQAQDILKHVDEQVHARDCELRLIEIYNRLDARSSTKYRKRDFKKSNLINGSRKLIKEGVIGFKTARGKEMEVLMVLLTDVVLFLEDNGQKYMFLSQDKKSGAVPLFKLLARENGSRRDKRSMYLITQLIDSYDMYEIVCKSKFECDDWIATFRNAIMKCPEEEDEGVPDEGDDELRKIAEAKFAKLKELVGLLSRKDDAIQQSCDERFKVIQDMCVTHGYDGILKGLKSIYKDSENMGAVLDPRDLLQAVVQEASRLGCLIQSNPANVSLSRSASSVGEHDSGLHIGDELPRRAETFAGFDNVPNGAVKRAVAHPVGRRGNVCTISPLASHHVCLHSARLSADHPSQSESTNDMSSGATRLKPPDVIAVNESMGNEEVCVLHNLHTASPNKDRNQACYNAQPLEASGVSTFDADLDTSSPVDIASGVIQDLLATITFEHKTCLTRASRVSLGGVQSVEVVGGYIESLGGDDEHPSVKYQRPSSCRSRTDGNKKPLRRNCRVVSDLDIAAAANTLCGKDCVGVHDRVALLQMEAEEFPATDHMTDTACVLANPGVDSLQPPRSPCNSSSSSYETMTEEDLPCGVKIVEFLLKEAKPTEEPKQSVTNLKKFRKKIKGIMRHNSDLSDRRRKEVRFRTQPCSLRGTETLSGLEPWNVEASSSRESINDACARTTCEAAYQAVAGSTKKRNLPEIPSGEGQDGRSASLQNLRQQESDTDSLQSPDSVDKVRDHNRVSRRPSIIHTLTNLVGKEDSESRATSDRSSDRGSGYFMELSTGSSSLQSLVAPSREQMESLTQLTKYLHELVTFANRQSTQVDSLRIQLAEAIDQAERLKASQKSNLERKSTFRANQQLEELRKLQEDVAIERKKWDKEKSREKQRLEAESAEMDLKHQEIAKELEELKNQKAELQRQKQAVQLQIDFFQLQKQQTLTSSDKDLHSTTKDGVDGSHVSVKGLHKRSASDDWSKFNDGDPFEPMDVQYSKSLKEPLNRDKADLGQNRPYSTGSAGNLLEIGSTSPSYGGQQKRRESGANVSLPEHLCSATNEVKSSNIQQKIPVKLSSLASSSSLKSFSVSKKDKDKDRGSGSHSNSFAFNLNNNSSPNLQESPHRSSRVSVGTKPNKSPSNILPLKLAESAGRKRSDSPSMHEHAPGSSSPMNQRRETSPPNEQDAKQRQHQQMPEQKVIYF